MRRKRHFRRHNSSPNMTGPFIDHSRAVWNLNRDRLPLCRGFLSRLRNKGIPMTKALMALVAVATLAVCMASPAYAWRGGWGWGPGVAAGLVGGAIVGGAIASSAYPYGYYGPGPYYGGPAYVGGEYGPCYWQRQRFWDGYGWRARNVRVCD